MGYVRELLVDGFDGTNKTYSLRYPPLLRSLRLFAYYATGKARELVEGSSSNPNDFYLVGALIVVASAFASGSFFIANYATNGDPQLALPTMPALP